MDPRSGTRPPSAPYTPATGVGSEADVDAILARASALRYEDTRGALVLAGEGAARARALGYRRGLASALRISGSCRSRLLELEPAFAELHEALALYEEGGDDRGRAATLTAIGATHWRRGDHAAAFPWHAAALALHRAAGDTAGEAETLNHLGMAHDAVGEYDRALDCYHAARRLHEELADRQGLSFVLNNLGVVHGRLGDFERAREYHERTLALKREIADPAGEAIAKLNLGMTHDALGDDAQALAAFHDALAGAREAGDRKCVAAALENIAGVHRRRGESDQALAHLEASLAVARTHGLIDGEAGARLRLGELLTSLGRTGEALAHLEAAMELASSVGSRQLRAEAHRALSQASEAAGDLAGALAHYKGFHALADEVRSAETDHRIRSLQVQGELARAQRDAELLRERNEALSQANEEKSRLLEQLRDQAHELERLSLEDSLTGLPNRRRLDAQLAIEWERAARFGRPLAVAIADIDHFKRVNDDHSHAAGDAVLRAVARVIAGRTRRVDLVARFGGEEFVLLLVETPLASAMAVCEEIRRAVEAQDWSRIAAGVRVTMSLGVASNAEAATPEAVLALADARLYEAKAAGRNLVRGAGPRHA